MAAVNTEIPNFPMIPLRRQTAIGAVPIDFTRVDLSKYIANLTKKFTKLTNKLWYLNNEKDRCEYQIGYYTNLIACNRGNPADVSDEDYEDYYDSFYTRLSIEQRYRIELQWQKQLEDEKFILGDICAEIEFLESQKHDLDIEIRRIYNYTSNMDYFRVSETQEANEE
jgi:hypothetical protein